MATDTIEAKTVEVAAEAAATAPAAKAGPDELIKQGWTPAEVARGEKLGLVAKPEEAKKDEPKKDEPVKAEEKPKPVSNQLPDFTMTPEQEKVFLDTFGSGTAPRAMYFRMKNERHSRQAVEARNRELEAELAAAKKAPVPETDPESEDQPLTLRQLRELQKAEAERLDRDAASRQERGASVSKAQAEQEEYARSLYVDFDATVVRAGEVMKNLEALVPEKWKQAKTLKLVRELQFAAANADRIGLEDYNAALIAYEIGQMHPEHGKQPEKKDGTGTSKEDPKANGGLTPEQMKRVVDNTQKRASSASVTGGNGRRTVSVEDVDLAILNKMTYAERDAFRKDHPQRYATLLRG